LIGNSTIQALFSYCREFNFSHVQPTPFLGCVVQLKALGKRKCFGRRPGVVKRAGGVGVQIVLDQLYTLHVRIMPLDEIV